jgi:hypothetical protein
MKDSKHTMRVYLNKNKFLDVFKLSTRRIQVFPNVGLYRKEMLKGKSFSEKNPNENNLIRITFNVLDSVSQVSHHSATLDMNSKFTYPPSMQK